MARPRRTLVRRRPARPLSKAQRLARTPRHPRAAELAFALLLRGGIEALGRAVLAMPLGKFAHQDAADGGAPKITGGAAVAKRAAASVRGASSGLAGKVQRNSRNEFKRLGINLIRDEPELVELIDGWRAINVERVTSLFDFEVDELAGILSRGANKTVSELRADIEERLDVSRAKADLLARDQVLTLNAQISQQRQQAAGIEQYIWTTANDERVRESHAEMDGETCSWADPPEVDGEHVNPGEPVNCRCVACPILPELDDG